MRADPDAAATSASRASAVAVARRCSSAARRAEGRAAAGVRFADVLDRRPAAPARAAPSLKCYTGVMGRGLTVVALTIVVAALTGGGCTRKPAHKAEAGQVGAAPATAPAATPTTEEGCRACNGEFGQHGIEPTP